MSILSKHRNVEIIPGTPEQAGTLATPARPAYYTTETVCEFHQATDPYYMRWATVSEQRKCMGETYAPYCKLAKYCLEKIFNTRYQFTRINGAACTLEGYYSIICVGYRNSSKSTGIVHATFKNGTPPPSGVANKLYYLMHPAGYEDYWVFNKHYKCDDSTGTAVLEKIRVEGYG